MREEPDAVAKRQEEEDRRRQIQAEADRHLPGAGGLLP
jgi:hypothetical protein